MDEVALWAKVASWSAMAALGLVGVVWRTQDKRVTSVEKQLLLKADRDDVSDTFKEIRDTQGQIFGVLREMSTKMGDNHAEVLKLIGNKVDR